MVQLDHVSADRKSVHLLASLREPWFSARESAPPLIPFSGGKNDRECRPRKTPQNRGLLGGTQGLEAPLPLAGSERHISDQYATAREAPLFQVYAWIFYCQYLYSFLLLLISKAAGRRDRGQVHVFRFSRTTLFGAVLFTAFGVAAIRFTSPLWAGLTMAVAVAVLFAAIVGLLFCLGCSPSSSVSSAVRAKWSYRTRSRQRGAERRES
jgi:hypothetical protein